MTSRADAYLTALAKTEGREITFDGKPVLTASEAEFIAGMERADFEDGFRRAIGVEQARVRLGMIFRGQT